MREKGFAPILIIILIAVVIGGYLIYSGKINFKQSIPPQTSVTPTIQPSPAKEIPKYNNGSVQTCGDIPGKAFPEYGRLEMRTGPQWSPDCKNIAWAMWQSGTGCPDCPKATLSEKEGVFLYSTTDKNLTTIYKPQKVNETPEFLGWVDKDNFIFKVDQKRFNYNLITRKLVDQNKTDTSNWKTYTNTKYGFEIKYPEGAVIDDKPDPTKPLVWIFLPKQSNQDSGSQLSIDIADNPKLKSVKDFCLSRWDSKYSIIEEKQIRIGDIIAHTVRLNTHFSPNISTTCIAKENKIIVLDFDIDSIENDPLVKEHTQILNSIISTFKFTN